MAAKKRSEPMRIVCHNSMPPITDYNLEMLLDLAHGGSLKDYLDKRIAEEQRKKESA